MTRPPRALVVWCPDWPVTATRMPADEPAAVIEQARVVACSAAARAAGVRRGQRVRDAQRQCPGLVLRDRDTGEEGRLFERVAHAVSSLTPWVEVVRPGVCAVPARGPARFHGGEESLRVHAQDVVVEAGFDCGAGIADGLFAAELAARADGGIVVPAGGTPEFLAPYPVSVLGLPDLTGLLRRLGIRTLAEFGALPPERVSARFGRAEIEAHRLARGLDTRLLATPAPAADLAVAQEFDPPARSAEQVVFAAKALAERLRATLAREGLTCVRLGVEAVGSDGRVSARLWRYSQGGVSLSALAVAERVRWQMSGWEPEQGDGVGGIAWLRLTPDQPIPETGRPLTVPGMEESSAEIDERVERAAARIQAMLGHGAVTRPLLVPGRSPAERVVRTPFGDLPPDVSAGPWPGSIPAPAPGAVHPEPLPAAVTDASGATVTVTARCVLSAPPASLSVDGGPARQVTAWTGPWPARERWWDADLARRRARFQIVTSDGRAHLLAVEHGSWWIEATYD